MKTHRIAFVYNKKGKYRVYDYSESLIHHESLIKDGYTHEMTIDTIHWIENNLNHENRKRKTTKKT
jgi:hypothetical protein